MSQKNIDSKAKSVESEKDNVDKLSLTSGENITKSEESASAKETRLILSERAHEMASEVKRKSIDLDQVSIIEFSLSNEVYGIENNFVREVYPLSDYTVIPGLPSFILGVINVRGEIISVINLKKLINLPEVGLGELNKVIIIENEHMEFGILADVILGTSNINLNAIQKKLTNLSETGNLFLKGVTKDHQIIFDAEKLLNYDKIKIDQQSIDTEN